MHGKLDLCRVRLGSQVFAAEQERGGLECSGHVQVGPCRGVEVAAQVDGSEREAGAPWQPRWSQLVTWSGPVPLSFLC